jgi:hypothetical protein
MAEPKEAKPYRVFVTRHYIAVEFFDVMATTPRRAKTMAKKAAQKLRPDPRLSATDNHWQADAPTPLENGLGSYAGGVSPLREVAPGVFKHANGEA